MRTLLFSVIFLSLSLAITANAQSSIGVTGDWLGTGLLLSFDGKYQACEKIELLVEQTDTTLTIKRLDYYCDSWEMQWQTVNAELHGSEIYYEGVPIGEVGKDGTGSYAKMNFLDLENKLGERVEFRVKDGVLSLYDELYALDKIHTYTKAEGELGPR